MNAPRTVLQVLRSYSTKSRKHNLAQLPKTMPKEKIHIPEAQRQRKRIKEKSNKYSPGRVALQVLGTGAKGAPRSLYVFSDQARYLFNCGEGTQRLAHEHKMKLAKLEHIFFTESTWKNIGGLPGAALTIQDVGVPEITLHGPRGLDELFKATRRFVVIKDLEIRLAECTEESRYEDNVMKVRYVPVLKSSGGNSSGNSSSESEVVEDDTDYYAHEHTGTRKAPTGVSLTSQLKLKDIKQAGIAMAYICQLQPRPGALCLDKCVRFGVPPGPVLGRLKAGEDITLANGTVVKSSDVCDPDDPGPVFIVVDCPSEAHLDSLVENETFRRHQSTATRDEDLADLVVHFTPKEIVATPRYAEWMDRFSPSTRHVVLNDSNTCMGSVAVHRIQHKLNLISAELFPLLGDRGSHVSAATANHQLATPPQVKRAKISQDECGGEKQPEPNGSCASQSDQNVMEVLEGLSVKSRPTSPAEVYTNASTLFSHHLRPKKGADVENELKLCPSEYVEETMAVEGFADVLQRVRGQLKAKADSLGGAAYPRVLFLGTGSSIPNKTRNTSGILLDINESNSMLLDCGEGTCGQIIRFYGQDKCDAALAKIGAIYVSHLHADHHLGLIGVLQGRREALRNLGMPHSPVVLFAPKQITWWLNFYNKCFETITRDFELVSNADLMPDNPQSRKAGEGRLLERLGLSDVSTCHVKHCPNSFGVRLTLSGGGGATVVYSGDTMPCKNLVRLGAGCDLLIHEATMEDDLADEAVTKMHSTTSQAIDIGRQMAARFTLLTHFSQRYAKLPRFHENFAENVGIAFDNMQVRLAELPLLPILYPALQMMFAEHCEELEHKAAKRQMRLEREKQQMTDKK